MKTKNAIARLETWVHSATEISVLAEIPHPLQGSWESPHQSTSLPGRRITRRA